MKFTPTAAGTRSAYVTVTDNANNLAGSTQNVALTGTGVAVPTPAAAGSRTATLTITDNANIVAGATQMVSLTGTGVGLPAAALNTPGLTFSNQNVGTASGTGVD